MKSKIFALAAILFCAVMLTSCDDSLEKRVLGTWMTTSVDGDTQAEGLGLLFSYHPDGTFIYTEADESATGTYTLDDKVLTMTIDEMPWSVTIKDVTKTEMTWIGPETGKDVVLTKQ